jgi:hypothetical protein
MINIRPQLVALERHFPSIFERVDIDNINYDLAKEIVNIYESTSMIQFPDLPRHRRSIIDLLSILDRLSILMLNDNKEELNDCLALMVNRYL